MKTTDFLYYLWGASTTALYWIAYHMRASEVNGNRLLGGLILFFAAISTVGFGLCLVAKVCDLIHKGQ